MFTSVYGGTEIHLLMFNPKFPVLIGHPYGFLMGHWKMETEDMRLTRSLSALPLQLLRSFCNNRPSPPPATTATR